MVVLMSVIIYLPTGIAAITITPCYNIALHVTDTPISAAKVFIKVWNKRIKDVESKHNPQICVITLKWDSYDTSLPVVLHNK